MKPYEKPSPQDCLAHYGVKGMKWGVRRYQNYDGSYTRKGLERYRKAESDYERAKSKAAETKAAHKSGLPGSGSRTLIGPSKPKNVGWKMPMVN